MTTAFDTAITDMLNDPNIGVDATWSGSLTGKRAFFFEEYNPELNMEGLSVWIEVLSSDFSGAVPSQEITVKGTMYKIKSPLKKIDDLMSRIELSID
jgi:hypothetical protein